MKSSLSKLVGPTIVVVIVGLWIFGTYHGLKKHDDFDPIDEFYISWFYGIESLWHKTDFKQLNDEITTASYLVVSKNKNAKEQQEHNETKIKFKKGLKRYSDKEVEYIKTGVNIFVKYVHSWQGDYVQAISRYKSTKEFKLVKSDSTVYLEEQCNKYGLQESINAFDQTTTQYSTLIKTSFEKAMGDPALKDLFDEETIMKNLKKERSIQTETYKSIFGE